MSNELVPPLTLSEADMRKIMGEVGDMIVDHFAHLHERPVTRPSTLAGLRTGPA